MRISSKGRIAIMAMLDIAILGRDGTLVALHDMADRQGVSRSYMEQLLSRLRKNELIKGVRGPGGGYRLARSVEHISFADIVVAIGDTMDLTRLKQFKDGGRILNEPPLAEILWREFNRTLYEFLDSVTLDQFSNHPRVLEFMNDMGKERSSLSSLPRHHLIFEKSS